MYYTTVNTINTINIRNIISKPLKKHCGFTPLPLETTQYKHGECLERPHASNLHSRGNLAQKQLAALSSYYAKLASFF